MRKNRFYYNNSFVGRNLEVNDLSLLKQWRQVLRLVPGGTVYLFNQEGLEVEAKIINLNKESSTLEIINKIEAKEIEFPVTLYLAILKKENFELAIQKAVEVGVSKIVPIITDHTVKFGLKTDRLQLIIKEAAEQSGRNLLPGLSSPLSFAEAVRLARGSDDLNIFCDFVASDEPIDKGQLRAVNIFVGPEGGWSEAERVLAGEAEFSSYSLGVNVLRAETAAIVATWLAVNKKI